MHWLRIDRYYSSGETFKADDQTKEDIDGLETFDIWKMEQASENPRRISACDVSAL